MGTGDGVGIVDAVVKVGGAGVVAGEGDAGGLEVGLEVVGKAVEVMFGDLEEVDAAGEVEVLVEVEDGLVSAIYVLGEEALFGGAEIVVVLLIVLFLVVRGRGAEEEGAAGSGRRARVGRPAMAMTAMMERRATSGFSALVRAMSLLTHSGRAAAAWRRAWARARSVRSLRWSWNC